MANDLVALKIPADVEAPAKIREAAERVRETLSGQATWKTVNQAQAQFGLMRSRADISRLVARSLPLRFDPHCLAFAGTGISLILGGLYVLSRVWGGHFSADSFSPLGFAMGISGLMLLGASSVYGFRPREAVWTRVCDYTRFIPDAALVKYAEARDSRLFSGFSVVVPQYADRKSREPDPWLVGELSSGEYIILAYWDDPEATRQV